MIAHRNNRLKCGPKRTESAHSVFKIVSCLPFGLFRHQQRPHQLKSTFGLPNGGSQFLDFLRILDHPKFFNQSRLRHNLDRLQFLNQHVPDAGDHRRAFNADSFQIKAWQKTGQKLGHQSARCPNFGRNLGAFIFKLSLKPAVTKELQLLRADQQVGVFARKSRQVRHVARICDQKRIGSVATNQTQQFGTTRGVAVSRHRIAIHQKRVMIGFGHPSQSEVLCVSRFFRWKFWRKCTQPRTQTSKPTAVQKNEIRRDQNWSDHERVEQHTECKCEAELAHTT